MKDLAKYIDHTVLKADATRQDISKLCAEAKEYGFHSVCVNSCWTSFAKQQLAGTDVKVAAVVGFPLGACGVQTKSFEAECAHADGADELDMVINIGALKDGNDALVIEDIRGVVKTGAVVKVILETCLLSNEEIIRACKLCKKAGAHFVKTSTGFSTCGATEEHVALMKKEAKGLLVKASGGIRDRETAIRMIEAGADRIGTSSGIKILQT